VIVVTPTDEIKLGVPFWGVAVTGTLPKPLTPEFVILPYQRDGRGRSGLKKKSAAKCDWLVELRHEDIRRYIGWVPATALAAITKYIASHKDF